MIRRHRGFSLLELLVVLVILGVLVSMYTLSSGLTGSDQDIEEETERLNALLRLASEDSTLNGREMGLRFYRQQYEFSMLRQVEDAWEWVPLDDDELFRPRALSEDYDLELVIEGREVALKDERNEKDAYKPQVFIFSSGEFTPFSLAIRPGFENRGQLIEVSAGGEIEITNEEG